MRSHFLFSGRLAGATLAVLLFGGTPALAGDESCREWLREHCDWKAKAISYYLKGAPQHELDVAVFEILQREAYLTSCEVSAQESRAPMVGWRLVGRTPDEYGGAVLESVLERAGLDLDLRSSLGDTFSPPVETSPNSYTAQDDSDGSRPRTSYARSKATGAAR